MRRRSREGSSAVWNIEISSAFWGPISGVEIALRNALHRSLVEHFARDDWWNHPSVEADDVEEARDTERRLARQHARRYRNRDSVPPPPGPDDVVAALSFGFWSSILESPKRRLEQYKYWHACLHRAVPNWHHRPNDASVRKAFRRRVELLRKFRNRIAHHEPIHERRLLDDHTALVAVAGFMHADLSLFIRDNSRVPEVLARRAAAVERGDCRF